MAIYNIGVIYPGSAYVGVKFLINFCFLSNSIGSRYARKPIKGSKDSDDNLDSKKNLSQKWLIGLAPRAT